MSFLKTNKSPQKYVNIEGRMTRGQEAQANKSLPSRLPDLLPSFVNFLQNPNQMIQLNNEDFGNRSRDGNSWLQHH